MTVYPLLPSAAECLLSGYKHACEAEEYGAVQDLERTIAVAQRAIDVPGEVFGIQELGDRIISHLELRDLWSAMLVNHAFHHTVYAARGTQETLLRRRGASLFYPDDVNPWLAIGNPLVGKDYAYINESIRVRISNLTRCDPLHIIYKMYSLHSRESREWQRTWRNGLHATLISQYRIDRDWSFTALDDDWTFIIFCNHQNGDRVEGHLMHWPTGCFRRCVIVEEVPLDGPIGEFLRWFEDKMAVEKAMLPTGSALLAKGLVAIGWRLVVIAACARVLS